MKDHFAFAKAIRRKIVHLPDDLTIRELNYIPEGFRNNIAWHIGHIVVSTEILCYHRTGIDPGKDIPYANDYRNGTVPKAWIDDEEIQYFKERLLSSLSEIEIDYSKGKFGSIQPYSTQTFGLELRSIEAVFECASHHDLLHYGHIQTMLKLLPH